MNLSIDFSTSKFSLTKDFGLGNRFVSSTLGVELEKEPLSYGVIKDLSLSGNHYTNSIQMNDYVTAPHTIQTQNFSLMPAYAEISDMDDSYAASKGLTELFSKSATLALGRTTSGLSARSYISVFNSFRSDFENFD